jgi:hypothetical protein
MKKWRKRFLIGFGVITLGIAGLIGFEAFQIWYENNYKSHIQTLELKDQNIQFVLLTDIAGFGDRAWYVYKMPLGAKITKKMKTGHNGEGVLFWNYSETGIHSVSPKLKVLKNKFLVFSRGGFYHSLYNIQTNEVIVNDENPWGSFYQYYKKTNNSSNEDLTLNEKIQGLDKWVRLNLHSKIEKILKDAI